MTNLVGGIFNFADQIGMRSLGHRTQRSKLIYGNIANSETPGYRAIGYDFESQLQTVANRADQANMKTTQPKHFQNPFTNHDGSVTPDVFVRPTETIPQDGNTVDIDHEMARMAQNKILYNATVEMLKRKLGILRYAINGGR